MKERRSIWIDLWRIRMGFVVDDVKVKKNALL